MGTTRQSGNRKNASSAKKKNTSARGTAKKPAEQETGIGKEIGLVVLLIVSVLLFVSNFGVGGVVGNFLSGLLFGCFGLFAYVLPAAVLLFTMFYLANRENLVANVKIAGAVLGCVAINALLHMITASKLTEPKLGEIFTYCRDNKTGGGLLGGGIAMLLKDAFGSIGAYLILIGVLIVCVVIVTERSFVKGMSKGSRKVYESARYDMERRREAAELRRERKKEQRLERKVSGVTSDVTIPRQIQETELPSGGEEETGETFFAEPERAVLPPAEDTAPGEPYPVRQSVPQKSITPKESVTGGLQEISFSEEDLLKNALSRRELEAERAREQGTNEPETYTEKEPRLLKESKPAPAEPEEAVQEQISVKNTLEKEYEFPPLSLLKAPSGKAAGKDTSEQLQETAQHLQQIMEDFGVNATVTNVSRGPAVTRYEVQPAHGVKVNKIIALADDIKLNLAVADVRMEAPIPGKAAVGIEVPNKENSVVMFRELMESAEFQKHPSKIAFAVGKDIGGNIMVSDIAKMPHLLIAGATGSGKSVCINTLIMSILYKARPDEVKLIMVDPKVVELSAYNGIPHLLIPVVTDPKKAAGALNWAVAEMMGRYNKFAELNVRNIEGYNSKIDSIAAIEDDTKPERMPQIVIIVDELADLMMVAPGEVEDAICRLAQLARAAGIHLIIATQRPSVNVITGLIKANMPSRIAFAVSSGVDSRTILDMNGAEKLLGKGDMLFSPYGLPKPLRVQGAFVSDAEVGAVVEFLSSRSTADPGGEEAMAEQLKQMQNAIESAAAAETGGGGSDRDVLFAEAGKFIIDKDKASIGMLQRWFKIGFNRAARIMDQLSEAGVVGEEEGTKPRKVLMSMEEFEQYVDEYV